MRVLYINHTKQKSGAGISLSTLLRNLPAGFEPFFLLPSGSTINEMLGATAGRTFEERFLCQFSTTRYTVPYSPILYAWHLAKFPVAIFRVWQLARRWKIDLVHVNETTLFAYAFAARLAGLPVVMHARTALAQRPFELLMLRALASFSQVRIAAIDSEVKVSMPTAAQALTEIIYNPIDLGPAPSAEVIKSVRASWGCEPEHVVIGQVASLHRQKGIWLILELAEGLFREFPNVRIVLVGDEAETAGEGPQLRAAIAERGLSDRLILAGYDSRLATVYAGIDIALCLFGGELGGVGRAAYEAAVSGKPLVATLPDPLHSETLENEVSGLLFSHDDKGGITNGLRRLIGDADFRAKLGASAQASIGARHAPEQIARTVTALYTRLVDNLP